MNQKIAFFNCLILALIIGTIFPWPQKILALVFIFGAIGKIKLGLVSFKKIT